MPTPQQLERFLITAFVMALCMLSFMGGIAVMRYEVSPYQYFVNAFIAAEDWYEAMEEKTRDTPIPDYVKREVSDTREFIINHSNTRWDKNRAYPGYTLVSTGFMTSPYLVDMHGNIAYRWDIPFPKGDFFCDTSMPGGEPFVSVAHLFPNGDVVIQYGDFDSPYSCSIVKADKHSKVLWVYRNLVHHDSYIDSNGNIYTLVQETIHRPVPGLEALPYPMLADYVIKLSPEGKEQQKISILDAFHGSPFELMLYYETRSNKKGWDFFHTNSVHVLEPDIAKAFPMFKPGDILISMRGLDTIAVIDHDTHKVVWAYHGFWHFQHAASFLPNGHIMLFDNRGHVERQKTYSRVIEFDPVTLKTVWSYTGNKERPFFTDKYGRLQRLPNGNTLVSESESARIFELTPEGEIVWNYQLQQIPVKIKSSNNIFTAVRYSAAQLPFLQKKP